MRVVHTVSSIESEAAGTTYAVTRLTRSIASLGHDVDLFSLGEPSCATDSTYRDTYRDRRFKRDLTEFGPLRRLGASGAMRHALLTSEAEIFHTHGLWMMPNVYPAQAARAYSRPFILSPHGMLGKAALQFSDLKKRVFWALLQAKAARQLACLHATAKQEYEDIRAFGLKQPVAIIPNGIDIQPVRIPSGNFGKSSPFVLSLGRIHPIKALDRLIQAWALVDADFPQWRLKIVGPSEIGHGDQLRQLARELNLASVDISGPVFGEEKTALLAGAELFALSTLHENFGMTVAESLAVGTPAISTKGAPWAGLQTHECGWWVDHGVEPLAAALRTAMSMSPEKRRAMGARGRAWMEREFGWESSARDMLEVYHWLVEGGERPGCVHEN